VSLTPCQRIDGRATDAGGHPTRQRRSCGSSGSRSPPSTGSPRHREAGVGARAALRPRDRQADPAPFLAVDGPEPYRLITFERPGLTSSEAAPAHRALAHRTALHGVLCTLHDHRGGQGALSGLGGQLTVHTALCRCTVGCAPAASLRVESVSRAPPFTATGGVAHPGVHLRYPVPSNAVGQSPGPPCFLVQTPRWHLPCTCGIA
jgi:hypothetical protein